jgi:drug/metabolite transporter (DMT)-like permease
MMRSLAPVIYGKLFLTACMWGGTFVAARVVAQHVPPFTAAFLRFVVASFFLMLLILKLEGRLPALKKNQWLPAVLLGITGIFAYNVFFFLGLQTVTASRASLIVACNPVFISILSALLFKERMTTGKTVGIVLCLAGAIIVISRGNPLEILQEKLGWGEVYILGCVASWVAYSLIGKVIMKDLTPLAAVNWSCLIGMLALLLPACWEGFPIHLEQVAIVDWVALFYLGFFGTVLGFIWYYEGIKAIGPSRAAVFINFVPVSGVFLGWLLLDESINLSLILGAVLVMGGVYLTNRVNSS